jgi:hypothetical protein
MSSTQSGKGNYLTRTESKITVNHITQYERMKGYYLMEYYHLEAGIDQSHHGLTSVSAPESLDRVFVECVITWLWVRAGSYNIGYVSS